MHPLSTVFKIYQLLGYVYQSFGAFSTVLGTPQSSAPQHYDSKAGSRCKALSSFPFSLGEVWGAKQWQTKVTWPTTTHPLRCWPAECTPEAFWRGRKEGRKDKIKRNSLQASKDLTNQSTVATKMWPMSTKISRKCVWEWYHGYYFVIVFLNVVIYLFSLCKSVWMSLCSKCTVQINLLCLQIASFVQPTIQRYLEIIGIFLDEWLKQLINYLCW